MVVLVPFTSRSPTANVLKNMFRTLARSRQSRLLWPRLTRSE